MTTVALETPRGNEVPLAVATRRSPVPVGGDAPVSVRLSRLSGR